MNRYYNYGLTIESDIDLPVFTPCGKKSVEVSISANTLPEHLEVADMRCDNFESNADQILIHTPHAGKLLVEKGQSIHYEKSQQDLNLIRAHLISSGIAAILSQRSQLIIHGNALVYEDQSFIIMGRSGAGKSTTTAALLQQGARILAEDIALLSFDEAGLAWIIPGQIHHKLTEDTTELLHIDSCSAVFTSPLTQKKFITPSPAQICLEKKLLDHVFFLQHSNTLNVQIQCLPSLQTLMAIRVNSYAYRYIQGIRQLPRYFEQITTLAQQVPCYHLQRPAKTNSLTQVVDTIMNQLAGCAMTAP